MLDAKTTLFVLLGVVTLVFLAVWVPALLRASREGGERVVPNLWELFVGLVTDFFDTLGIGSFATTTTLYRARRTIDDRLLPGTLNIGHTLPTILQAFLYIDSVKVEMTTLVSMIVAAVAGSLLGAPIVARWPRAKIQVGLGLALLALVSVLVYRQLWTEPKAGTEGLEGGLFAAGVTANFILGALMTIGVGLYAPCLVLVTMLGMNPSSGFPIMMGSCAFLMPLASVPFIRQRCYSPRATLGLALAGLPAVWVAAKIVKSLDLYWVQWLVAVVVVYTAITLLRAAAREKKD
ncbi:MAG: permease [Planctomycetes bacterium]|nr:permease [Planctomycetota bacterium]